MPPQFSQHHSQQPQSSLPAHPEVITRLRRAGCVFAEEEAELIATTARTPDELRSLVERRVAGAPLEHVLGWVRFRDLRLTVEPGVFVPRPRSEFHVEQALALTEPGAVVLDLCCGTGALGAALATERAGVELHAADIDAAGVRCARHNLAPLGGEVYQGDLFTPLPDSLRGRVDVMVANAPYVPTREITLLPSEARDHEPWLSLDGGSDGLDVVRRVAGQARPWLAPGGHLLVQTHPDQVAEALAAFIRGGLDAHAVVDEEDHTSVVVGRRPDPIDPKNTRVGP
ncbi:putative protein N(5)-glutamine methyltransferase [Nocardiopsis sp. JB363]|uniref:putative protein N(5)-glutamine methyltransferase n=1 Tax=Nocardiopsis sp. JB363 TaxID=1434837 RepID=UPI00097B5532|nr:putative protein N(5)-glutamine methyltransferase [Nocardiopsis sp. JB363]SIO90147.1 Protein-N(5)-glutamine methyltransferase PrmC, methylates polypeptide chain release factors RF1 and RF2 [Nocardiopsis sp. JB363]